MGAETTRKENSVSTWQNKRDPPVRLEHCALMQPGVSIRIERGSRKSSSSWIGKNIQRERNQKPGRISSYRFIENTLSTQNYLTLTTQVLIEWYISKDVQKGPIMHFKLSHRFAIKSKLTFETTCRKGVNKVRHAIKHYCVASHWSILRVIY